MSPMFTSASAATTSSSSSSSPLARSSPAGSSLSSSAFAGGLTNGAGGGSGGGSTTTSHVNKLANRLNNLGGGGGGGVGQRSSPTPSSPTSSSSPSPASPLLLSSKKPNPLTSGSANSSTTNGTGGGGGGGAKLLTVNLIDNSNGVACSLVKSNTNIYYNLKVDSIASKAIHYCDHCANPDCRAIHKSLSKPLLGTAVGAPQIATSTPLSTPPARIYLTPSAAAAAAASSSSTANHPQSPATTPNAGTKGANINFIFERRYPLVQLNGNLLSAAISEARSTSPNSNHNHHHPPTNHHHHHPQRILIRPHSTSEDGSTTTTSAFPLPLSPSSLHHAVAAAAALAHAHSNADPTKPATFSINFNRLAASARPQQQQQQQAQPQQPQSPRTPVTPRTPASLAGSLKTAGGDGDADEPLSLFPTVNINNLRYKNIMFLDQFNNKDPRSQSPTTTTSSPPPTSTSSASSSATVGAASTTQQHTGPVSVRDLASEKYSAGGSVLNAPSSTANNNTLKQGAATPASSTVASTAQTFAQLSAANKQQQQQQQQQLATTPVTSFVKNGAGQITQQQQQQLLQNNKNNNSTTTPSSPTNEIMMQRLYPNLNNINNNEQLIGANKFKPTFLSASDSNLGGGLIGANNNNNKQANATSSSNDIGSQLKSQQQQSTIASSTQQQNLANTAALKDNKSTTPTTTKQHLQGQQQHAQTAGGRHHHHQQHHPAHHHQAINVPQFYFPHGRHDDRQFRSIDDVECMKQLSVEFKAKKDGKMFKEDFIDVTKLLGLPCYWKILLFRACTVANKLTYVTYSVFEQVWSKLTSNCYERVALFMKLISGGNPIVYEDWEPLLQDIVDSHPGLKFLHDHKEFHTRYIKTVIARIYYTVNRSWSGKITATEMKKSNFLDVLESLEYEDDINVIKDFFSYEHFYVIYCKFWELDKDHDLYISREDLYRHNNYAISARVIDRIFNGTVLRGRDWREGLMSYYDFVWFLISEEDKRSPTSVEYWFRVLDVDGDGVLSMYELEYFYNEQIEQMRERQIEYMPFTDLLCQMLDLVKPIEPGKIRLKDLKQCKMANVFFDTFINLEKYLEYEQRDPFSNIRDLDNPDQSDWDKYAAEEYENLVSEDVNGDNGDMYNNYEDDFEDDALIFNNNNSNQTNNNNNNNNGNTNTNGTNGTNGAISNGGNNNNNNNSNGNGNSSNNNSNSPTQQQNGLF